MLNKESIKEILSKNNNEDEYDSHSYIQLNTDVVYEVWITNNRMFDTRFIVTGKNIDGDVTIICYNNFDEFIVDYVQTKCIRLDNVFKENDNSLKKIIDDRNTEIAKLRNDISSQAISFKKTLGLRLHSFEEENNELIVNYPTLKGWGF